MMINMCHMIFMFISDFMY